MKIDVLSLIRFELRERIYSLGRIWI